MGTPDPLDPGEVLYTVAEAAQIKGKHPATIRRWIKAGLLPAAKCGRDYEIRRSALIELGRPIGPHAERIRALDRANQIVASA